MALGGRVYLETTVLSCLTARPSRDLRVAAHQQVTSEWWTTKRDQFEVYISQLVLEEVAVGDEEAAARRLEQVEGISLLALTDASLELAEKLVADGAVPREAQEDALHIAVAAVHGMDYLLTWNCRHIANATMRSRIQATCFEAGYDTPVICTPRELIEDMWKDEIVEEVREARRAHAAAHGHDLRRIFDALKRKQEASGRHVVTLQPKPARSFKHAAGPLRGQ